MLDRHAVQELLRAGVTPRAVAKQFQVSRRTVERIASEAAITSPDVVQPRPGRRVGRPNVAEALRARIEAWLTDDPALPPGEVWRLRRDDGTPLGLSTVYRVLQRVRATMPAALLVRFEGVAGEFAQLDFGHVSVQLTDGARRVVHFAAYRLKYSRWMHVVLVPNERVEALVRALLDSFVHAGNALDGTPPSAAASKRIVQSGIGTVEADLQRHAVARQAFESGESLPDKQHAVRQQRNRRRFGQRDDDDIEVLQQERFAAGHEERAPPISSWRS